ncbi:TIGR02444 family protein [Pseudoteredinibacter isoporae]|uniref:TIGR02444 family protein n=1 Tax=Pseudoteredinibacter isoporae TaxID=570281 RepID=UPI003102CB46
MTEHNENLFWLFSLDFYGEEEVAETLLTMQDEYGCQVNMILWCLWLGQQSHCLGEQEMKLALEPIVAHQVRYLLPMRDLRRQLKCHPEVELYQQAKALELAMERWEQDRLYALSHELGVGRSDDGRRAAEANVHLYMTCLHQDGATRTGSEAKLDALIKRLLEQLFRG